MKIKNHDDFPTLDHRNAPSFCAERNWVIDSPPIPRARAGMSDTINWGIFKRHFWGELLRHQHMIGIASRLAHMNGWAEEQVVALRTGTPTSDAKIDVLTGLVREAAANSGNVTDATWKAAQQAGWSDEQLTDAFAYLGATVFTGYFLNYAQTDLDL